MTPWRARDLYLVLYGRWMCTKLSLLFLCNLFIKKKSKSLFAWTAFFSGELSLCFVDWNIIWIRVLKLYTGSTKTECEGGHRNAKTICMRLYARKPRPGITQVVLTSEILKTSRSLEMEDCAQVLAAIHFESGRAVPPKNSLDLPFCSRYNEPTVPAKHLYECDAGWNISANPWGRALEQRVGVLRRLRSFPPSELRRSFLR